jgi:uncharacterized membrane protein YdjX (TVP38/TMEM64 family)
MFGNSRQNSIVQRGIDEVFACRDLVEAAPTQASAFERVIARIVSVVRPSASAPPCDANRDQPVAPPVGNERLSAKMVQRVRLGSLLAIAVTLALAYFLDGGFRAETSRALAVLTSGNGTTIGDYLRSFGVWAPVASILLMVLQALAAPIPAILVAFANGLTFGAAWGGLITLTGQTLAAVICFWIARALGRGPVEALAGKLGLETADRWFTRHGARGIFILRLVPGVSFDVISYAAGLTGIGFVPFLAATIVGVAPQAFLYAYLIRMAPQFAWAFYAVTWLAVALLTAVGIARAKRKSGPGVTWKRSFALPRSTS